MLILNSSHELRMFTLVFPFYHFLLFAFFRSCWQWLIPHRHTDDVNNIKPLFTSECTGILQIFLFLIKVCLSFAFISVVNWFKWLQNSAGFRLRNSNRATCVLNQTGEMIVVLSSEGCRIIKWILCLFYLW